MNIKTNKAQCLKCLEVIESKTVHDFVRCKCGSLAVDGGRQYLKRSAMTSSYKELSEYEKA